MHCSIFIIYFICLGQQLANSPYIIMLETAKSTISKINKIYKGIGITTKYHSLCKNSYLNKINSVTP